MRFISMHKSTPGMEAGEPPPAAVMEGMGPLMEEMIRTGIFESGEGLLPSSMGVRLVFSNGQRTIVKGPLAGSNELTDRYMIIRVPSMEDAIEWATRFADVSRSEIDIRPVTEPWDLGFFPKPADVTDTRFMILHKADSDTEAGRSPRGLGEFLNMRDELQGAGKLVAAERLQPSSTGIRLRFKGGKYTVTDGPFTESKELVAGFSITRLDSRETAVEWARRFAELIGDVEIDIRPLYDI